MYRHILNKRGGPAASRSSPVSGHPPRTGAEDFGEPHFQTRISRCVAKMQQSSPSFESYPKILWIAWLPRHNLSAVIRQTRE
jgi:hypothetical protein